MLAALIHWSTRSEEIRHLIANSQEMLRSPLGVLAYLPLIPLYWLVRPAQRPTYLIGSSVFLALLTIGPAYTIELGLLSLLAFFLVKLCAKPGRVAVGVILSISVFLVLVLVPQPPWLPPVKSQLYFYLHGAGLAYMLVRTIHVLVDVSKKQLAMPKCGEFLAYLLFAPTLRMGPIFRFPEFQQQMLDGPAQHRQIGAGLIRIACGLFRFGVILVLYKNGRIERLYNNPTSLTNRQFLIALYVNAINMYFWVSGYADCSIGIGRILGFKIPENFNYPWRSTSVAEFWRRWHLTLGSWLRDYVYIPLGGNRRHVTFNYLITFLLCGLWHGLYLSYAAWGLSQGIALAVGRVWKQFWTRQAEQQTPIYRTLDRIKLVNSPITIGVAWLLTFNYQILTITWFLDEHRLIVARVGRLLAG